MFTGDASGDVLYAALHRTGFAALPTSVAAGDGQSLTGIRIVRPSAALPRTTSRRRPRRRPARRGCVRDLELATPRLRAILCLGAIGWAGALAAATAAGWDVPRPSRASATAPRRP